MNPTQEALDLIEVALTYEGERISDPGDLPSTVDGLAALAQTLGKAAAAARRAKLEVEATLAQVLGAGVEHRYGDHVIVWSHGWKWQPQSTMGKFVVSAVESDPGAVLDLFPMGAVRKTGIEKVAKRMGLEPETVVRTVLNRAWDDEPGIQWKYKPIEQEDSHGSDSNGPI